MRDDKTTNGVLSTWLYGDDGVSIPDSDRIELLSSNEEENVQVFGNNKFIAAYDIFSGELSISFKSKKTKSRLMTPIMDLGNNFSVIKDIPKKISYKLENQFGISSDEFYDTLADLKDAIDVIENNDTVDSEEVEENPEEAFEKYEDKYLNNPEVNDEYFEEVEKYSHMYGNQYGMMYQGITDKSFVKFQKDGEFSEMVELDYSSPKMPSNEKKNLYNAALEIGFSKSEAKEACDSVVYFTWILKNSN